MEVDEPHMEENVTEVGDNGAMDGKIGMMEVPNEFRRIRIPLHRMTPLRENWNKIYAPIVNALLLQIRMNLQNKCVEIRTSEYTHDAGAIQKAHDFVRAFALGFEVDDALAIIRLDDIFLETFEITDIKMLKGDHLSRAIGRVAGKGGRTKYAIENATKTRIVLADAKVHLLGSYNNIHAARDAIMSLILGSPPNKVYAKLQRTSLRLKEQF